MAKTKKYSLPYWVKAHTRFQSQPETSMFLPAIKTYVERSSDGGHPEILFAGSPLELANALYLEWKKRGKDVWAGLFPTPLWLAQDAARLLNIQPGQIVLDVGCGFGNLMWAAQQCGAAKVVGIELQGWVVEWGKALGFDVRQGDFVGNGYEPPCAAPEFDVILTNPAFGKMFGSSDVALDFMARIASISRAGTLVAAILPSGYMSKTRPKKLVEMAQCFETLQAREIAPGTFSPLTPVATTLYLVP
jgi:predicted RNA methylase